MSRLEVNVFLAPGLDPRPFEGFRGIVLALPFVLPHASNATNEYSPPGGSRIFLADGHIIRNIAYANLVRTIWTLTPIVLS